MKNKPFLFILSLAISLVASTGLCLPVHAQSFSPEGGGSGFDVTIGDGNSECTTSPGSSTVESTNGSANTGELHSLFSDAVYLIPPEFYRLTYTNPITGEVYDSMCIRKGPETVCVPYESGSSRTEHPCETFTMTAAG